VFHSYGPSHWCVLVLTVTLPWAMGRAAKGDASGRVGRYLGYALAALLVLINVALLAHGLVRAREDWVELLPMHFCDWLAFIAAFALVLRRQWLYDLTYFWGLAGTVHGLLTPDLQEDFPHFYFFTFFIPHAGILIAVGFMTFGLGFRPYLKSMVRAFAAIQVYVVCAMFVNWMAGTNFGYLRAKPSTASLMDHLGPWPWYLVAMQGLALVFMLIYYAPWWIRDRVRPARGAAGAG
jgi:hypothetical integral membrane protein (TIGR02206 family)